MEREFSLKELYDVHLKLTYPIEIGNKKFEEGETIAFFDKIQLANFNEIRSMTTANGGFDNRPHVFWESTKAIELVFQQGVFSRTQFALLNNCGLVKGENNKVLVSQREIITPDKEQNDTDYFIKLKHKPINKFFVYNQKTGDKIDNILPVEGTETTYNVGQTLDNVIVDYTYQAKGGDTLIIGEQFLRGYLTLEGKTRTKDDVTGQVKTGIIKIPKLKLMSSLSMRLGEDASPIMGVCQAVGYPEGDRRNSKVMEIFFLDEYVDDDM